MRFLHTFRTCIQVSRVSPHEIAKYCITSLMVYWLTLADELRTSSIDFDECKLRIIKEFLV